MLQSKETIFDVRLLEELLDWILGICTRLKVEVEDGHDLLLDHILIGCLNHALPHLIDFCLLSNSHSRVNRLLVGLSLRLDSLTLVLHGVESVS